MAALFRRPTGEISAALVVLFLLINGLVLVNAVLHDPEVQYDPQSHLKYARALAEGHLPDRKETAEYYVPPLPYVVPALLMRYAGLDLWWAAKGAQLFSVLLSVGITLMLLALCEKTRPGSTLTKFTALLLLGLLPVYYRSLTYLRGEPYIALFALAVALLTLRVFSRTPATWPRTVALGVVLGLTCLSRQLGFFVPVAVAAFALVLAFLRHLTWKAALSRLALSLALCVAISGWFFHGLHRRYGSALEFNREDPSLSALFNRSQLTLFFDLHAPGFFTHPLRPTLGMRLLPVMYADTWGDYHLYYLVFGQDTGSGKWVQGFKLLKGAESKPRPANLRTNFDDMGRRIGRANVAGLLPSAVLLAGFLAGLWITIQFLRRRVDSPAAAASVLSLLTVGALLGGFVCFLFYYGRNDGFLKATYLLHGFPFLALLAAGLIDDLHRRSAGAARLLVALLGLVALYNLPLHVSRYIRWPLAEPAAFAQGYGRLAQPLSARPAP